MKPARESETLSTPSLFDPVRVGALELPNRVVLAPMTRYRSHGGVPGALNAEYYAQRAGAGLIVSESVAVSGQSVCWLDSPGIYTDAQVAGWRAVTDAVHAAGGRIFAQLFHCGRRTCASLLEPPQAPVAPSPLRSTGSTVTVHGQPAERHSEPHALTTEEVPGIVAQFAAAARNARAAGFDGIELHAANGFLLDQFLRDGSNRRTDRYGGNVANRLRLLLEVFAAVAAVVGADRVGVHISPANPLNDMEDSDPAGLTLAVARALEPLRPAYLHVVEGATGERSAPGELDSAVRAAFGGPVIVNNLYTQERARAALASGRADLVSFGRLYIANPDLVERFRKEASLNALNPATLRGPGAAGYTDYPFMTA